MAEGVDVRNLLAELEKGEGKLEQDLLDKKEQEELEEQEKSGQREEREQGEKREHEKEGGHKEEQQGEEVTALPTQQGTQRNTDRRSRTTEVIDKSVILEGKRTKKAPSSFKSYLALKYAFAAYLFPLCQEMCEHHMTATQKS